jgi:hypothetical protein
MRAPVAHTCNPSYSGGRDQKDHSSKPARANKKNITKWTGGVAQDIGPEFKPQYLKKKKKKKKERKEMKSTITQDKLLGARKKIHLKASKPKKVGGSWQQRPSCFRVAGERLL